MFKKVFLSLVLTLLFLPRLALAAPLQIPAGTLLPGTQPVVQDEIKKSGSESWFKNIFAGNLINLFVGFVALLAVFFLVIAGYQYLTAFGNEEQTKKAKKNIIWSLSGVGIVLLAFTVVQIIINIQLGVPETEKIASAPAATLSTGTAAPAAGAAATPTAAAGDFCGKLKTGKVKIPSHCTAGDAACNTAAANSLIDLCTDFQLGSTCEIAGLREALHNFFAEPDSDCAKPGADYTLCTADAIQNYCDIAAKTESEEKAQKAADEVNKERNLDSDQGVKITLITNKGNNQYEIECQYNGKTSTVTMDGLEDTARACANKALGCSADKPVKVANYQNTAFTLRNEDCKSYLSANGTQLWIPQYFDGTMDGSATLKTFSSTTLKEGDKVSEYSGGFSNGCLNAGSQTNYTGGVAEKEFSGTFQLVNGVCSFKTGDLLTLSTGAIEYYRNGVVIGNYDGKQFYYVGDYPCDPIGEKCF
jgi:hypothetical protein